FFVSSRRRHTRWPRDWSSDVCSSDLINVKDMLSGFFGQQKKKRKMTVSEAFDYLIQEEENKLIDMDHVTRIATERAEQMGIIFRSEERRVGKGGRSRRGREQYG